MFAFKKNVLRDGFNEAFTYAGHHLHVKSFALCRAILDRVMGLAYHPHPVEPARQPFCQLRAPANASK